MTDDEIGGAIDELELELGLPATDPLTRPLDQLADMVLARSRSSRPRWLVERAVTAPRLEIDLDARSTQNARTLVDRLARPGHPRHRRDQGDARLARVGGSDAARRRQRPRRLARREPRSAAGRPASTRRCTLIRSPMLSQVDEVVRAADVSLNTEPRC